MKKLLALFLLFATIGYCGSAHAGIISISMTAPSGEFGLGPGDRAGVVPSVNWNNVPYAPNQNGRTTIGQVIFGSDGEESPLGLTYRAWDGRNSGSVIGNDPNARMMKGKGPSPFNSSSDPHTYAAIELTGCNAAAGAVYDVYVYINEGIGFTTGSYGTMYLSGAGTFGSGGPPQEPPSPRKQATERSTPGGPTPPASRFTAPTGASSVPTPRGPATTCCSKVLRSTR